MIFILIVPCILCCIYAWRRRQKYLEGKLPPVCAGAWPVVGHVHLWLRGLFWPRLLDMQRDCLNQGGMTYLYSGINSAYSYYAISDPSGCAKLANGCIEKFFPLEDTITAAFGEGLATSTGPVWESHRSLLEPMFDQMSASLVVPNQQAKILFEELATKDGKGFFDQTEYLQDATMGILLRSIYGAIEEIETKSHKTTLQNLSDVVYERHQSFFKHKKIIFRWSNLKRRQSECVRLIKALTNEMITRKRVDFNKDAETMTLLDFLLRLEIQGVYSEQNTVDEVIGILFGGYNTIVNSLNFILVMLGSHNAVQKRICTEIQNVLSDSTREINMEDLNNFTYLHAVVIEVLRLYPPVTTISRKTTSSVALRKYSIDPGTNCLLFIYAMNRDQSWGADREEFRPERRLDGSTHSPIASFGLGRRSCIGMNFALNTMKIILIYLLRNYKVTADHTKLVIKQELMLTPVSGHYIALEKR